MMILLLYWICIFLNEAMPIHLYILLYMHKRISKWLSMVSNKMSFLAWFQWFYLHMFSYLVHMVRTNPYLFPFSKQRKFRPLKCREETLKEDLDIFPKLLVGREVRGCCHSSIPYMMLLMSKDNCSFFLYFETIVVRVYVAYCIGVRVANIVILY